RGPRTNSSPSRPARLCLPAPVAAGSKPEEPRPWKPRVPPSPPSEGLEKSCLSSNMRPIFCGTLDYDARQSEIERLFGKYGRVERVDMKTGFAFVYMEDERDAEDAIHRLDRTDFGRKGRRLRVEWTKVRSCQQIIKVISQ
uniref:RRM domain-containing protein n=1 Tax=Triticum urartu TaxID=4572 RepID=A0A8R7QK86_TRIUA